MKFSIWALSTLMCTPAFGQVKFELKSMAPGITEGTLRGIHSGWSCMTPKGETEKVCFAATSELSADHPLSSFANVKAISWLAVFNGNTVDQVSAFFPSKHHEWLRKNLQEKFGSPKDKNEPWLLLSTSRKNDADYHVWADAHNDRVIVLEKRGRDFEESHLFIYSSKQRTADLLRDLRVPRKDM